MQFVADLPELDLFVADGYLSVRVPMAETTILRENVSIPVGEGRRTSGILALPANEINKTGVIVAHGAGNDMEAPLLAVFSDRLALAGYATLRFNFIYKERGLKAPDSYKVLTETWLSAAAFFSERLEGRIDSWMAAGKSMGGRVASQMIADGLLDAHGLIFLGYPLHPAGKKEKTRDSHLYRIAFPMLFFAGMRDPLCDLETLRAVLDRLSAPWSLHVVEGGDHSFHVPKSAGMSDAETHETIVAATLQWLERGNR